MRYMILALLISITLDAYSQNKRDYVWTFGYDGVAEPGIQAYRLDFNIIPFEPRPINHAFRIDSNNSSISDEEGNLLFYTNGCAVSNKENEIMSNGIPINDGSFLQDFWGGNDCLIGYPGIQDIISLPDPGNEDGYYILHKPRSYYPQQDPATPSEEIRFTYVDMSLNNGLGDVTVKDSSIYFGERLLSSYFTAINHTNGRDWWIIQPLEESNKYKRFLLDSSGIAEMEDQEIGPVFDWNASSSGTAKFSPDGTKYAYYNESDGLLVADFDREFGLLSNMQQIAVFDTIGAGIFCSVEWSPNSRYIYTATKTKLHQIDTEEDYLADAIELVGVYDGTLNPFPNTFFLMALAPDCKIYMCSTSGNNAYHVINKPDEKGSACQFVQNGLELPISAGFGSMPNHPRWRVDEDEKCDPSIVSMFGELLYYQLDLNVFPNPTTDLIHIELPENKRIGKLVLLDNQGKAYYNQQIDQLNGTMILDLVDLPKGIYHVDFVPKENKERRIYTAKVIKV